MTPYSVSTGPVPFRPPQCSDVDEPARGKRLHSKLKHLWELSTCATFKKVSIHSTNLWFIHRETCKEYKDNKTETINLAMALFVKERSFFCLKNFEHQYASVWREMLGTNDNMQRQSTWGRHYSQKERWRALKIGPQYANAWSKNIYNSWRKGTFLRNSLLKRSLMSDRVCLKQVLLARLRTE